MTSQFLVRNCPSCGLMFSKPEMVSTQQAESLSFEKLQNYWVHFFKEKIFFSYHRCQCGLLYCQQFFTAAQLEQLYAHMPDNTANVSIVALEKTQYGYFSALKKFSTLQGNYLEVGPDIGLFTQYGMREGNFQQYWLFEPNKTVWPTLKNRMEQSNIQLVSEMFSFDVIPDNSISTAVFIHVLDHLLDPAKTLQELKKKLTQDARVLFVTHDESSLLAKLFRQKWPPYCLQHPQLFNPDSITEMLKCNGYDVVNISKSHNYFPLTYLLRHTLYAIGIDARLPQWNALQLPLKLGNIITIAKPASA